MLYELLAACNAFMRDEATAIWRHKVYLNNYDKRFNSIYDCENRSPSKRIISHIVELIKHHDPSIHIVENHAE